MNTTTPPIIFVNLPDMEKVFLRKFATAGANLTENAKATIQPNNRNRPSKNPALNPKIAKRIIIAYANILTISILNKRNFPSVWRLSPDLSGAKTDRDRLLQLPTARVTY